MLLTMGVITPFILISKTMTNDPFWDAARAMAGCPRTEKVSITTYSDNSNPLYQPQQLTPPTNTTQNSLPTSVFGLPLKLIQGCIATGAALGVVLGAGLNINFLASAFVGGVGAGLGSVAASINKKKPEDEARKLLSGLGNRYALSGDVDKLALIKQITGDLEVI